jgi:carbonic anhydrase/acetyltransferase-like protein (isoleucine patch superfamily)
VSGPTPAPSDLPAFLVDGGRAPLRLRARRLRLRLRWGKRLELGRGAFVGSGVRFSLARAARLALGEGAWLGDRSIVRASGEVRIGAGTLVGRGSVLAAQELISIGAGCLLGDEVMASDCALTVEDALRVDRPLAVRPVSVGDGARVGPRACLLAGSEVGPGAVVGPREVVVGALERQL